MLAFYNKTASVMSSNMLAFYKKKHEVFLPRNCSMYIKYVKYKYEKKKHKYVHHSS